MGESTDYKIIKALESWEAKEGSLPESLQLYRELLGIQSDVKSRVNVYRLDLTRESVAEQIVRGRSILNFDDLCLDRHLLADAWEKIASLLASYSLGDLSKEFKVLPDFLEPAAKAWFEGTEIPRQLVDSVGEDLAQLIIGAVLKPFLSRHSEALLPLVNQEQWRRGYCPICGGSPDFALLDKERGARWLLCSRCDARWLFQRMECHSCGNQDQNELSYFTDDSGLYRLYVCEKCKCYLKAVDLRKTENEVLPPLERFITLDLDKQAQEKGYSGGGGKRVALSNKGG